MDKGIYTALSGGIAKGHEIELIANNLANATTPGFKRDTGTFNEYLQELRRPDDVPALQRELIALTMLEGRPPGDKSFVEMDGVYTDFRQGNVRRTGRDLDVAINGQGYFEVLGTDGPIYTRAGNFSTSAQGLLVTADGKPVLSAGDGPAEGRTIQLAKGKIAIDADGGVYQFGNKVTDIKIQEFHEPQWLEKVGGGFFRNAHPANIKNGHTNTEALQGFLEGSNVNPVREMTKLIQATRSYEMHMSAIKTFQQIDKQSVSDIARE